MDNAPASSICAICVDMGTTNTRLWLVRGNEVLARAQARVGVRDTARNGSRARIHAALRDLIQDVRARVRSRGLSAEPTHVIAAGMITSPLGLEEVPHVFAPAGATELAASVRRYHYPEVTELPILLVPGVRSGPRQSALETVGEADVMRGEETLCLGLIGLGLVRPPATILNLGSHWKAIRLDAEGRIQSSVTSLSGELIHAAQTQTILASAVPQERPARLDEVWCEAGMKEQRRSGLARALFCVRLLEVNQVGAPEQRMSFLIGVFVAAELDALLREGVIKLEKRSLGSPTYERAGRNGPELEGGSTVFIVGSGAVASAWRDALEKISIRAVLFPEVDIEAALLAGLRAVAEAASARLTRKH